MLYARTGKDSECDTVADSVKGAVQPSKPATGNVDVSSELQWRCRSPYHMCLPAFVDDKPVQWRRYVLLRISLPWHRSDHAWTATYLVAGRTQSEYINDMIAACNIPDTAVNYAVVAGTVPANLGTQASRASEHGTGGYPSECEPNIFVSRASHPWCGLW